MKRASILGALAVAAGFFLAAPAANATHSITPANPGGCTLVNNGAQYWPGNGHHYDCGDIPGLSADTFVLPTHIKTKFHNTNVWVFLWKSAQDYDTYHNAVPITTVPLPPGRQYQIQGEDRTYGITGNKTPGVIDINLFERVRGHDTCTLFQYCAVDQTTLSNAFVHEVGHALDLAYGSPSQGTGAGTKFNIATANSFTYMNSLAASAVFPLGIPTKKITGPNTWVTYTIPPTSDPQRNEKIVKQLMPYYFDGSPKARAELFANSFAQYRQALAGHDWTNPYGPKYRTTPPGSAHPNDPKLLTDKDVYIRLRELTKTGSSAPQSYFYKLWTDPAFVP